MDVDWTVFETFAISVAFLVIKVLAMGPLTARQRFKHKVKFVLQKKLQSIHMFFVLGRPSSVPRMQDCSLVPRLSHKVAILTLSESGELTGMTWKTFLSLY